MKIVKKILLVLFMAQISYVEAAVIDAHSSVVAITFKQMGVEVGAKFNAVSGTIDFDPANPANGKAKIAVTMTSFDLGDPEYSKEVQKAGWFNSPKFPQATFVSSSIKPSTAGNLLVQGRLTIKGRALDISIPVAFRQQGKVQVFEGSFPIKRLYFNIGEGEWKDTDTLADAVIIKFKAMTLN